jgi:predicted metal-dependent HD superfamily phosphohydrolase
MTGGAGMKRVVCLKRRWRKLCAACGAGGDVAGAYGELDRRYRGPGRCYHTWKHVAACLGELGRVRPPLEPSEARALELALWFHDAVYDPGAGDNEEASARLANHWGSALGLDLGLLSTAAGLILATRHGSPEAQGTPGAQGGRALALIQDIDLAVLGSGPWCYRGYARRIRKEYAWMPDEAFRRGRAEVLRSLLQRGAIYSTPQFRRRCERRARRNLERELAWLEGGG